MDANKINVAVKITLTLVYAKGERVLKLRKDLERIKESMTQEEYNEYQKRVN